MDGEGVLESVLAAAEEVLFVSRTISLLHRSWRGELWRVTILGVWEDDHLSGRRCQACGLTQKSVEEIAVHQRVGGKALACYSLF